MICCGPKILRSFLYIITSTICFCDAYAATICGDPPPSVPTEKSDTEKYSGDLSASARLLESLIGKGQFQGKADYIRKRIYQDPDQLRAALNDQRFAYAFCRLIEDNETLSIQAKLEALKQIRSPVTIKNGASSGSSAAYNYFDIKPDGYAELTNERVLLKIVGFAISSGRQGEQVTISLNGKHYSMFPGDRQKVSPQDQTECNLDVVKTDDRVGVRFRTDCTVQTTD